MNSARAVCLRLLLSWEKKRPFADELLHEHLAKSGLVEKDRAWVTEIFYGVLRNLTALDFLIGKLKHGELDLETSQVLRLGFYQLFFMRVPEHAAVNETVKLTKRARPLVNALMRRAIRERAQLEQALAAESLEVRTSHPDFLVRRWEGMFGHEATAALCAWNNSPSPVYVRVNTLLTTHAEVVALLPGSEPGPHPLSIKVDKLPRSIIEQGLVYVQDPSTLLACDFLAPEAGDRILDACAAPGGKSTYLAALMRNEGHIVACDLWESRVSRLTENCQRLGVRNVQTLVLDTMKPHGELAPDSFDRILIDAPCSNTGVIRRRVDVRWRLTDEDFLRMPVQQMALLRRCAGLLRPGGTLVYSTCSLETEENDRLVDKVGEHLSELQHVENRRSLPWKDAMDGAFAAKFVRV